ncbi:MAG: hypothetical protein UV73_C0002G0105 [Candidatus Gottesmanbacteria bacterium GW2011_GWA2_43_14]|uniref:Uncharacterized protein n=1 Tax=Candidatus Gottesmanbacteria bacterium GW2011_GWA2_43_14 TaxID=1618443 RepID=A0A0G1FTN9_9BACT|nr:MAG: hypothetical protein UV73_C0002G0105 [Candidatus Gottesmanbacteria bacterium GW2011_GWA2_43_14]
MNFFRKHRKFWTVIIIISTVALVVTSLAPVLFLP